MGGGSAGSRKSCLSEEQRGLGTWTTCAALVPHALAAVAHAERSQASPGDASWLLHGVATYLRGRAEFARSKANLERALAIHLAAYGPDHPDVGTDLNSLGLVLQELGDLQGARANLERVLLEHPEYSYAALYDKKNNLLVSRTQPGDDHDAVFCGHAQEEINTMATWMPLESSDMAKHLRMMGEKGEQPVEFYDGWTLRDNQQTDWTYSTQ